MRIPRAGETYWGLDGHVSKARIKRVVRHRPICGNPQGITIFFDNSSLMEDDVSPRPFAEVDPRMSTLSAFHKHYGSRRKSRRNLLWTVVAPAEFVKLCKPYHVLPRLSLA